MTNATLLKVNGVEIETTIDESDLQAFADAASSAGLKVRDYSGRGMYGNETLGARFESQEEYADFLAELPTSLRSRIRLDSMGRASIVYLGS